MRRNELSNSNQSVINQILDRTEVGSIGVVTADGYPRVIPINFVRLDEAGTIGIHCAKDGAKWVAFQSEPKVTFSVYIAYSLIPSYWLSGKQGCGATHYFKSVQINGQATVPADAEIKAHMLQSLMEKFQPEGGYTKITTTERMYIKPIEETGVMIIKPERVSCKIKFGQGMPDHSHKKLITKLEERGEPIDLETAEEIRALLSS